MKTRSTILLGILAVAAFAVQDPISLVRNYKEGEKDSYKLAVTATLPIGTADINLKMTQMVKKVFENGDADIETKVSDMQMLFGGNEVPMPATDTPATTQRIDKFGRPVTSQAAAAPAAGMMSQMNFLRYAGFFGDKPVGIGSTIEVDTKDEKAETRTWGKVTLQKVENGQATVMSDLKMTSKQTGEKAISMKFVSLVDTATGKIDRVDGDVTDLPANEQGMTVDSVKVTMQREK